MYPISDLKMVEALGKAGRWASLLLVLCLFLMPSVANGQRLPKAIKSRMDKAMNLIETAPDSAMTMSWQIWEDVKGSKDLYLLAVVRSFLGYQGKQIGDMEIAYIDFTNALSLLKLADTIDYYNLFVAKVNLGEIHSDFNDHKRAIEYFEEAGVYCEMYLNGNPSSDWSEYFNEQSDNMKFYVAIERSKKGDLEEAKKMLLDLLNGHLIGDASMRVQILNELGIVNLGLKNFGNAIFYFEQIINDAGSIEEDKSVAYHNLGSSSIKLNELEKAKEYYLLASEYAKQTGDKASLFITYVDLGEIHFKVGDFRDAINVWEQALSILPDPRGYGSYDVYDWLKKGHEALGQYELAKTYETLFNKYKTVYEKSFDVVKANEDRERFDNLVERLRSEELKKELQKDYRLIIILAAVMAVLLTSLVLIRRKKTKQKKLYEQLGSILKGD